MAKARKEEKNKKPHSAPLAKRKRAGEDASGELFRVKGKVSATGVGFEARVSDKAPGLLARLFPVRAFKSAVTMAMSDRIVAKIRRGAELDDAELEFTRATLGGAESKWLNVTTIVARAEEIAASQPPLLTAGEPSTPDKTSEPAGAATSDDWFANFREDAGLVSDQMLQEIYARLLVKETGNPASCSMRTLRTLRYMDHNTATSFAKLASLAFDNRWIPRHDVLERFGLPYNVILELDDAGLVDSSGTISTELRSQENCFVMRYGEFRLKISGLPYMSLEIYPLRIAGTQLSRIAQVERDFNYLTDVAQIFLYRAPSVRAQWIDYNARIDSSEWREIPRKQ